MYFRHELSKTISCVNKSKGSGALWHLTLYFLCRQLMSVALLKHKIQLAQKVADLQSAKSLEAYLNHLVIDSSPEPRRFGDIKEPWQDLIFKPLIPRIEYLAGMREEEPEGPRWFWYTLPKGHDKTTGEGRLLNFLLAYGKRKAGLNLIAAAKDLDQAKLILDAMRGELKLNPWLDSRVVMNKQEAVGQGGVLKLLTSDAAGNQGQRPHLVLCDELTCWPKKELYTSLASGVTKNNMAALVIITNAGVKGSWQWDLLQEAKQMPQRWHVFEAPEGEQLASWMKAADIDAMRKQFPKAEGDRLYGNRWTEAGEESGYLTKAEVQPCEVSGADIDKMYQKRKHRGTTYYASVDYGPVKDRTVMCVVHKDKQHGTILVDRMDVLQGSPDTKVQIADVEAWMKEVQKDYHDPLFVLDPYQLEGTIQKFTGDMYIEAFEFRGGKGNYKMAELLRTLIINKRVAWPKGCGQVYVMGKPHTLVDEISELIIRKMSYGYRFDHVGRGHDDRAVALGMACLACVQNPSAEFVNPNVVLSEAPGPEKKQKIFNMESKKTHNPFNIE